MAGQRAAYTLTDRGTFLSYRGKLPHLEILVEGDLSLLNPYAAILVNPEKFPWVNYRVALAFVKFLISDEGQRMIGEYRKGGQALFIPMARDVQLAQGLGFPDQAAELAWYDSQVVTPMVVRERLSGKVMYWGCSRTLYSMPSS